MVDAPTDSSEPPDPTLAFATFGRVMANIAMVEQIMRLALGRLEQAKMGKGEVADRKIERFQNSLLSRDFGQLNQLTVDKFKLPKHWLVMLKDAKSIRDNYAHGFWNQHVGYLRSEEGLSLITRLCEGAARHMELVAHDLLAALHVDLNDYIAFVMERSHDPEIMKGWEELLAANEAALQQDEVDRGIVRTPFEPSKHPANLQTSHYSRGPLFAWYRRGKSTLRQVQNYFGR